MTKEEAAIVTAYTGYMIGDPSTFHAYVEKLMGHSIFTHELANPAIAIEISQLAHNDFINIKVE